jgi:WD40 repeat protein
MKSCAMASCLFLLVPVVEAQNAATKNSGLPAARAVGTPKILLQRLASHQGGFTLEMPGGVRETPPVPGKSARHKYEVDLPGAVGGYEASFIDLSDEDAKKAPHDYLAGHARDFIAAHPCKVLDDREFTANPSTRRNGRMIHLRYDWGHVRVEWRLYGCRLYSLVVYGSRGVVESAEAARFFRSFALLPPGDRHDAKSVGPEQSEPPPKHANDRHSFVMEDKPENLKSLFETIHRSVHVEKNPSRAFALFDGTIPDEARARKGLSNGLPTETVRRAAELWKSRPREADMVKLVRPTQSVVRVHGATTEEIAKYDRDSVAYLHFPGGASRLAAERILRPGVRYYEVEFLEPGKDSGMKYHLVYWDGASWSMLGPLWRTVPSGGHARPAPSISRPIQPPSTTVLENGKRMIESLAFSPDGKTLASCGGGSGGSRGFVWLWDVARGRQTAALAGHTDYVYSVAFSPDGATLATGGADGTVRLWDPVTGKETGNHARHSSWVQAVAFSPDGKTLASAANDKSLLLWGMKSWKAPSVWSGHEGNVTSLSYSPDSRTVASASSDGTVRIWVPAAGTLKASRVLKGSAGSVYSVAFHPEGKRLASGGKDKKIRVWDVAAGEALAVWDGLSAPVNAVAFSPDGTILASGDASGAVVLWDVRRGTVIKTIKDHTGWVSCLAFAPDGKTLASGSHDGTIRLTRWAAEPSELRK